MRFESLGRFGRPWNSAKPGRKPGKEGLEGSLEAGMFGRPCLEVPGERPFVVGSAGLGATVPWLC